MAKINVPDISAGEVTRRITKYYCHMIEKGVPCREIRPIMLFGPTGVGKSTSVYAVGAEMERLLKRKVKVLDIRLTTCSITDLTGIPTPNAERTRTVWLRPDIFMDDEGEDTVFIYFFDELDKASPAVQGAALQMILDRKAWKHEFPKNTLVIAAANPARGTRENETRFAPELLNRFKNFNVQPKLDSFREWALQHGVHPYVLGYLSFAQNRLYADTESQEIAFPTPRSWKSVSDTLLAFAEDEDCSIPELFPDIAGEIGTGVALEFIQWCEIYQHLPSVERILEGKEKQLPKSGDSAHALISSLVDHVFKNAESIKEEELGNVWRYVQRLSADFVMLFYVSLQISQDVLLKLMKVKEFVTWSEKNNI